jgi:hypothetical protein
MSPVELETVRIPVCGSISRRPCSCLDYGHDAPCLEANRLVVEEEVEEIVAHSCMYHPESIHG